MHAFISKFLSDQGRCLTGKEVAVDTSHNLGFVFDDDDLAVSILGVAKKVRVGEQGFTFSEPTPMPPRDVLRDATYAPQANRGGASEHGWYE
ncbi:Uncharacterised protein [Chlamydia trachomatis]|nr:Uncharacterised protein [Chlamydia trachomatis]